MKINKRQATFLNKTITQWQQQQLIDNKQAQQLKDSYDIINFDWKLLATYCFWMAISCFIIAVILLVADDYLMMLLTKIINTPANILMLFTAIIACLFFYLGVKRRHRFPEKTVSNEAIFFFGVLLTSVSSGFLSATPFASHWHDSLFVLFPTIIYLILGLSLRSILIWSFGLLGIGVWILTETSYLTNNHYLFFGMNIPLRFIFVGFSIFMGGLLLKKQTQTHYLYHATKFIGASYFFISLWLLTIFGNYDSLQAWSQVKQIALWEWSLSGFIITLFAIVVGIKYNDRILHIFGITFFILFLYSRYIEFCWDIMHKTIFFSILALSFWLLGNKAEKIWQRK